jgi:TRAP-type mannitol/chloroaromatic compound transport system permease small subunit
MDIPVCMTHSFFFFGVGNVDHLRQSWDIRGWEVVAVLDFSGLLMFFLLPFIVLVVFLFLSILIFSLLGILLG